MNRKKAHSINARAANSLVEELQLYFVAQLDSLASELNTASNFLPVEWLRDQGVHGGGIRYVANNDVLFNRGSVNVSQVHYQDLTEKSLASATALSTIIHPRNPFAPSVHMHISWTEMKNGKGYWRIMADLNPSIVDPQAENAFTECLKQAAPEQYDQAAAQGDRYFFIPALNRHRGVSHFYLEEYHTDDAQADFDLAHKLGKRVIDCYIALFSQAIKNNPKADNDALTIQLAYHTLYLFQVLTLDRGTTSGLLIHNQNDVGIMGSLPEKVDKQLLSSWVDKLPAPQNALLKGIIAALPEEQVCLINEKTKITLAHVLRQHFQANPKAISLQAQGNTIPSTVANHQ